MPESKLENEIIGALCATLNGLPDAAVTRVPLEPQSLGDVRPDAMLVLSLRGNDVPVVVETLGTAYPRDVRNKIQQIGKLKNSEVSSKSEVVWVLAANTVSTGARAQLKENDIGYFDTSGSLFLSNKSIYILIDRPPLTKSRKISDAVFKGQRAQVLHYLFYAPDGWASVKEISTHSGISAATVSETLTELERREWVETEGRGPSKRRKLRSKCDLLIEWSDFVSTQKPPKIERFRVPETQIMEIMKNINSACKFAGLNYAISGEAAALMYQPNLAQTSQVICRMDTDDRRQQVLDRLEAEPTSKGWNLAILPTTGKTETIRFEELGGLRIARPVQVYLDLLQGGDQPKKMAQYFRETLLEVGC